LDVAPGPRTAFTEPFSLPKIHLQRRATAVGSRDLPIDSREDPEQTMVSKCFKPQNPKEPVEYGNMVQPPKNKSSSRAVTCCFTAWRITHTAPWLPAHCPTGCPHLSTESKPAWCARAFSNSASHYYRLRGYKNRRKPIGTKGTSYQGDPSVPFQNRQVEFFEL
jgi:hypothetical protein